MGPSFGADEPQAGKRAGSPAGRKRDAADSSLEVGNDIYHCVTVSFILVRLPICSPMRPSPLSEAACSAGEGPRVAVKAFGVEVKVRGGRKQHQDHAKQRSVTAKDAWKQEQTREDRRRDNKYRKWVD